MINIISEMLSYSFLVRAIIVGILVSLCSALLGVSLVLKHYSMIGDGLSHVAFGALAVATVMNIAPLTLSIPVVILAAFLLLRLNENSKIKGDAAIAMISTGALAIGVMTISMTTGVNTDICNYLFGSILAMNKQDVVISISLCVVVLLIFILLYNRIFAISFDEGFSRATGIKVELLNMAIAILTALTVVIGMRMIGSLLMTSLIIFPALTSLKLLKTFRSVIIVSALISIIAFLIGTVLAYVFSAPLGASVVLINILIYVFFSIINIVLYKRSF